MAPGVFAMFSFIEWLIFGFIGANMALAGFCLLHRGVRKFGAGED